MLHGIRRALPAAMGRLSFPWPPRALAANRRAGVHWGAVQGAKTAYRAECEAIVRSVSWGPLVPGVVPLAVIGYVGKGQRMPDLSDIGYLAKTQIDVMVAEGVLLNDSPACVRPFFADCFRDHDNPRVDVLWGQDALEAIRKAGE